MQLFLEHNIENIRRDDWNRLLMDSPTNSIFQTYEWHLAWWQVFQANNRLFLVCAKEKDRLMGIAPLAIIPKGRLRILKFIGTGHSDYCDFIYPQHAPDVFCKMFSFIAEQAAQFDGMALDYIPQISTTVKFLNDVSRQMNFNPHLYSKAVAPALLLSGAQENIQNVLNKKSLNRHYKFFAKDHGLEILHLTKEDEIHFYLDGFFTQHIDRRKTVKDISLFTQSRNQEFYRKMLVNLCPEQRVIFTVIKWKGNAIAYHLGFSYNRVFTWYKPSFDMALAKHSPGEVLMKELIEYAQRENFQEFDFTVGSEAFKKRFASTIRQNYSFKILKSKRDYWMSRTMTALKGIGQK